MGIKPEETELLTAFEQFWTAEKIQALNALCSEERMNPDELDKLIRSYLFTNRLPLGQEIINALNFQPKILGSVDIYSLCQLNQFVIIISKRSNLNVNRCMK
jgi:hypothetical protein